MAEDKKPETLKAYEQNFSDAIKAALQNGDLAAETKSVTAKIDKLNATGGIEKVDFEKPYTRLVAKTPQGALVLADGKQDTLLEMVTDAYDQSTRSNVRAAIVSEATGPEAAVKKAAAALAKQFNIPLEMALAQIRTMPAIVQALGAAPENQPTEQTATA